METPIILRGARVVDPANGIDEIRDLAIADGIVLEPGAVPDGVSYALEGKVVAPGFIDLHVHLREPGQTHKEDLQTGTRAAAAGGFTTIVAMPNTTPPIDRPARLENILERARQCACIRVLQTATLTLEREGRALTAAAALKAAGAVALTDDGACIQSSALMLEAIKAARRAGIPILEHAEAKDIAGQGAVHAGPCAEQLGVQGVSGIAEELIVARDAILAKATAWPVHIQHISAADTVALLRWAQSRGIPITAEATPHHIALTAEACFEHGANAKMNPPLRTEQDRQAILAGLADNTICAIATDHAPHTAEEKAVGFAAAPCGIIGLEYAVPICLTELYHEGILSLSQFVAKFTSGPKQVLNLAYGSLEPGAPGDLTVLDLDAETTLDVKKSVSRSRNCPYDQRRCRGKVVGTIVGGRWVYREPSSS